MLIQNHNRKNISQDGFSKAFTLFELVIVLAVISAMVAVVMPFCLRSNEALEIKQGCSDIAQALRYAIDLSGQKSVPVKFIYNKKLNFW